MQEAIITQEDLGRWADFLLTYSLGGISAQDRVMIKGERVGWPLMEVLERKVIEAGGIPDVYLVPPNNERGQVWSSAMGRHAQAEQLDSIPDWHGQRYQSMTKYVEVMGAERPESYAGLKPKQIAALAKADYPFADIRVKKPWVITLYPTEALAAMEGMTLERFAEFVVGASTADPALLKEDQERIAPYLAQAQKMTIVTEHPQQKRRLTLELGLHHSRPVLCIGANNFPDGEICTSPDGNSATGEVYFDLPIEYGGEDIQGVYLKLDQGEIVAYDAQLGLQQLTGIIETDSGSKRLGEVALGMNPGLSQVLKNPLFVEKVAGTLHIAIGDSYAGFFVEDYESPAGKTRIEELKQQGVINESAQHVDIVIDFRPGGCGREVWLDDSQLVVRDGMWVSQ